MIEKDYTNKDYEAVRKAMLDELKKRVPEYTDTSQSDFGIVLLELFAKGIDVLSFYQDIIHNEVYLSTAEQKENILKWCEVLGYTPATCTPAYFKQVFVRPFATETPVTVPKGTMLKTQSDNLYFELIEDLTIPANTLGNETDSEGNYLYTATVVQGTSITGEPLGESDGSQNQEFPLSYNGAILDTLNLITKENSGNVFWTRVDNFLSSSPSDNHYRVLRGINSTTQILFGDGTTGRVPPEGAGIYCSYRVCSGEKGNVSPRSISVCVNNNSSIQDTFNPETAFIKGQDDEPVSSIKVNAPAYYKTMWRAVTYQDYVDLILSHFSQVVFASAVSDSTDKDKVIISILTDGTVSLSETISQITAFFEERRIVGTDFEVYNYQAKPVNIEATLLVRSEYSRGAVKKEVENFLTSYFKLGKIGFGTELSTSELSAAVITSVRGVKGFKVIVPETDTVQAASNEIFTIGTINISASGGVVDEA